MIGLTPVWQCPEGAGRLPKQTQDWKREAEVESRCCAERTCGTDGEADQAGWNLWWTEAERRDKHRLSTLIGGTGVAGYDARWRSGAELKVEF
jgi:hypothetical protein